MNRILLFFSFLLVSFSLKAQDKTASPNAPVVEQSNIKPEVLVFKESEFDFGKIPQGKPVNHTFTFINKGTEPVALENVHASCGCTTPQWTKDTIPPGGSSQIKVGFNSAAEGDFARPITVTYNGTSIKQLIIKGEVWKTPVTSAPENSALNKLKHE